MQSILFMKKSKENFSFFTHLIKSHNNFRTFFKIHHLFEKKIIAKSINKPPHTVVYNRTVGLLRIQPQMDVAELVEHMEHRTLYGSHPHNQSIHSMEEFCRGSHSENFVMENKTEELPANI